MSYRAVGLVAALTASVAAGPVRADPASFGLGLEIYAAGLHALSVDAVIRIHGSRYEGEATTRTRGLLDLLFAHRGRLRSEGALLPDGVRPARHAAESRTRFGAGSVELTYRADGTVSARLDPPDEDDEPVSERLRRDTLDPLSAFLLLVRQRTPEKACRGTVRIFDGRRRYDLEFSYVGPAVLAPTSYGLYAGPADRCRARYRRVGKDGRDRQAPPRRPPAEVWLAPLGAGGTLVPVRIDAETRWGRMVAHLVRLEPGRPEGAPASP